MVCKGLPMLLAAAVLAGGVAAGAQAAAPPPASRYGAPGFRVRVGGQANLVWQGYPAFAARFSGPLSLPAAGEWHATRVLTLTTRMELGTHWRVETDLEAADGVALGAATGLTGITNLDVTRGLNPALAPHVYLARLYAERQSGGTVWRIGRMDLADDFGGNAVLGDSHRQFLNWSNNIDSAWDYAADTRGYTDALEVERGAWKLGYALMPREVNGMRLDWRSSQIVAQRELRRGNVKTHLLAYATHARAGQYDRAGADVNADRRWRWKEGGEASLEWALPCGFALGARAGLNNDAVEELANTESASTVSAGLGWSAARERSGIAWTSNGLSAAHAAYLRRGGLGFVLGDGGLVYGREGVVEWYWTHQLTRRVSLGPDVQRIANPSENRARGPVLVGGLRVHAEF